MPKCKQNRRRTTTGHIGDLMLRRTAFLWFPGTEQTYFFYADNGSQICEVKNGYFTFQF